MKHHSFFRNLPPLFIKSYHFFFSGHIHDDFYITVSALSRTLVTIEPEAQSCLSINSLQLSVGKRDRAWGRRREDCVTYGWGIFQMFWNKISLINKVINHCLTYSFLLHKFSLIISLGHAVTETWPFSLAFFQKVTWQFLVVKDRDRYRRVYE